MNIEISDQNAINDNPLPHHPSPTHPSTSLSYIAYEIDI